MTTFTTEELTEIANDTTSDSQVTVERDGLRFVFGSTYDDRGVIEHVQDVDCYGTLAWPVYNRYTGNHERPPGFTGAARKFGPTNGCDTIWWEPYREGHKVYDSPEEVAFMRDLLDWGFIGLTLTVHRQESCGHWHEVASESLWGIESPLVGSGNHDYLAEVYADLIHEALHSIKEASV